MLTFENLVYAVNSFNGNISLEVQNQMKTYVICSRSYWKILERGKIDTATTDIEIS